MDPSHPFPIHSFLQHNVSFPHQSHGPSISLHQYQQFNAPPGGPPFPPFPPFPPPFPNPAVPFTPPGGPPFPPPFPDPGLPIPPPSRPPFPPFPLPPFPDPVRDPDPA